MNNNNTIRNIFPLAAPLKTRSGAQRRLRFAVGELRFALGVEEIETAVFNVGDGFLAVAYMSPEWTRHATSLARLGVCVSNDPYVAERIRQANAEI